MPSLQSKKTLSRVVQDSLHRVFMAQPGLAPDAPVGGAL